MSSIPSHKKVMHHGMMLWRNLDNKPDRMNGRGNHGDN